MNQQVWQSQFHTAEKIKIVSINNRFNKQSLAKVFIYYEHKIHTFQENVEQTNYILQTNTNL